MLLVYKLEAYPREVATLAAFKRNSRLPPAIRDKSMEKRGFLVLALLRSAFIGKKHRANIFFSAEDVKFLREMAWDWGADHYARETIAKRARKDSFKGRQQRCIKTAGSGVFREKSH